MNFSQLSFGFFHLKIYGVFVALAFLVGMYLFYKAIGKRKVAVDVFVHSFWYWLLLGLFVGRIFVLFMSPDIISNYEWLSLFAFWDGGIYFYGVCIGLLSFAYYSVRKTKTVFWKWIDIAGMALLTALLIVDIGGFVTGAVYGTPASFGTGYLPWGVKYETMNVKILEPVHPVTLYAFIFHAWILWFFRARRGTKLEPGRKGIYIFMGVVLVDFLLSFFRTYEIGVFGGVNVHQILLVALFVFLLTLYVRRYVLIKTS